MMIDETKCPLCNGFNNCMAKCQEICWCSKEDVKVPDGLIRLVPLELKGKACICHSCIKSYMKDPDAFALKYKSRKD